MTETAARETTPRTTRDMATRFGASDGVAEQLQALREELAELRAEVVRLDADLDESRRLNLRAAELLDVVYEELGTQRAGREERP